MVAGNEIHQAEIEARRRAERLYPILRAGRRAFRSGHAPGFCGQHRMQLDLPQGFDLDLYVACATGLGQGDEGQAATSEILTRISRSCRQCGWVTSWIRAPTRLNRLSSDMITLSCHFGVFALGPGMGAIFAIAGNVKDRPQFLLQLQRLYASTFPSRRSGRPQAGSGRAFRRQKERSWDGA
jgi:hypothetical protein